MNNVVLNRLKRRTMSRSKSKDSQKLHTIRALYFMVYNNDAQLHPLAVELFHVLGEILEGKSPQDLTLRNISKQSLLQELSTYD